MAVQTMVLAGDNQIFWTKNRILGLAAMFLSPMFYIASKFYAPDSEAENPNQIYASLCGILYLAGALASATAMRNLRVTGNGRSAKILYFVQVIGLLLAMGFDLIESLAPGLRGNQFAFICDLAYPFSHLLLIVVGIAVVRAKIWRGWRQVPAFLAGFTLPAFFGASALAGFERASFIFPLFVTAGFFGIGLAVVLTKTAMFDKEF